MPCPYIFVRGASPLAAGDYNTLHESTPLSGHEPDERNLFAEPDRRPVVREMKDRLLDWMMTADETDQIEPRWRISAPKRG